MERREVDVAGESGGRSHCAESAPLQLRTLAEQLRRKKKTKENERQNSSVLRLRLHCFDSEPFDLYRTVLNTTRRTVILRSV